MEASVNFLEPMVEKPRYFLEAPPGTPHENMRYKQLTVQIKSTRECNPPPSINREGFEVVNHYTAVSNIYDQEHILSQYYTEMEDIVRRVTGSKRVHAFDWNIRSSAKSGTEGWDEIREKGESLDYTPEEVQPPVRSAHNDYTDLSGPQRVKDLFPDTSDELLKRRFAIINVWKPITGPVREVPLAICDARTIRKGELVDTDLVYSDRIGETSTLTHSSSQRWFYVPDMEAHEAMLIKCYDSDLNYARFTAHTAVDDPSSETSAPPRESIEVRTLALF